MLTGLMYPFVNIKMAYDLYCGGAHASLAVQICLSCLPSFALSYALFQGPTRRKKFRETFGFLPSPPGIQFAFCKSVFRKVFSKPSFEEEVLTQLVVTARGFFKSLPWTVYLVVVFVLDKKLRDEVGVSAPMLAITVASSIMMCKKAYAYFESHSRMTHEGNWNDLLINLYNLGDKMAPPSTLDSLLTERDVVVSWDLTELDFRGWRSIAQAIKKSGTLETVVFDGCLRKADGTDVEPFAGFPHGGWQTLTGEIGLNRGYLRSVAFEPAICVPEARWDMVNSALDLEIVMNGDEVIFEREIDDGPLSEAVEADSFDASFESADELDDENTLEKLAARAGAQDHWRALAGILARYPHVAESAVPMVRAARNGALASVELLLFCGTDPSAQGSTGKWCGTALHAAAMFGHLDVVERLLDADASLDARDSFSGIERGTPLHASALHNSNYAVTGALIEAGAEVDERFITDNSTTLYRCAQFGTPKVAQVLLDAGADIDARNDKGRTPLMEAAHTNMIAVVRVLLAAGADLALVCDLGNTAFDWANQDGHHHGRVKILLKQEETRREQLE